MLYPYESDAQRLLAAERAARLASDYARHRRVPSLHREAASHRRSLRALRVSRRPAYRA